MLTAHVVSALQDVSKWRTSKYKRSTIAINKPIGQIRMATRNQFELKRQCKIIDRVYEPITNSFFTDTFYHLRILNASGYARRYSTINSLFQRVSKG